MKKAVLFVSPAYLNDRIFDENSPLNRDDCLGFFRELKFELAKKNIDLHTQDKVDIKGADYVFYNDMPKELPNPERLKNSILFIFESELIIPQNWKKENHQRFSKIFTWHDGYVDNKKYFKTNFTATGHADFLKYNEKTKFLTMIAGRHSCRHPLELYSKREDAIKFYEKNYYGFFDFYGRGWDTYTFKGPTFIRALNKVPGLRKALAPSWINYKGLVDKKLETFRNYKFSICFENAQQIPGYITEKIFDSLLAGCIPVYWGAPNVQDYVNPDCFIDFRKFENFESLHNFLVNMTEAEYNRRLSAIEKYLNSEKFGQFTPKIAAQNIVSRI